VARRRQSLSDFDDSTNGAYFITICTFARLPILTGRCRDEVEQALIQLPARFAGTDLDDHMLMPDHLHAILWLEDARESLPTIVQAFKSITTVRLNRLKPLGRVWQRGYYERVIKNDDELASVREYVQNNPLPLVIRLEEG